MRVAPALGRNSRKSVKSVHTTGIVCGSAGRCKCSRGSHGSVSPLPLRLAICDNREVWNISRQIVWGMRIPAWRCEKCAEWTITDGAAPAKCHHCSGTELTQDSDTFDTWFS